MIDIATRIEVRRLGEPTVVAICPECGTICALGFCIHPEPRAAIQPSCRFVEGIPTTVVLIRATGSEGVRRQDA